MSPSPTVMAPHKLDLLCSDILHVGQGTNNLAGACHCNRFLKCPMSVFRWQGFYNAWYTIHDLSLVWVIVGDQNLHNVSLMYTLFPTSSLCEIWTPSLHVGELHHTIHNVTHINFCQLMEKYNTILWLCWPSLTRFVSLSDTQATA